MYDTPTYTRPSPRRSHIPTPLQHEQSNATSAPSTPAMRRTQPRHTTSHPSSSPKKGHESPYRLIHSVATVPRRHVWSRESCDATVPARADPHSHVLSRTSMSTNVHVRHVVSHVGKRFTVPDLFGALSRYRSRGCRYEWRCCCGAFWRRATPRLGLSLGKPCSHSVGSIASRLSSSPPPPPCAQIL